MEPAKRCRVSNFNPLDVADLLTSLERFLGSRRDEFDSFEIEARGASDNSDYKPKLKWKPTERKKMTSCLAEKIFAMASAKTCVLSIAWIRRLPVECRIAVCKDVYAGASKFFGDAKDFCPNFPKLARKIVLQLLPTNFLPQRSWRPIFGVTSKKMVFICFCANGRHFCPDFQGILPRFSMISPKYLGITPGFSTNQNFWGCAFTPAS